MRLIYFARVREAIGVDGEERSFPADAQNIVDVLDFLVDEDSRYAQAFSDRDTLRFALDQSMVGIDADMTGAEELAIFPPVTGG